MATLSVAYCSAVKLSCTTCAPAEVILCVDPDYVAPGECPGSEEEMPYDFGFIEASLDSYTKSQSCCATTWKYVFTYDDALLADINTPLTTASISGVFCKGCMTSWIEEKVGAEPYIRDNGDGTLTFVSPHGCEYTFTGELI